MERCSLEIKSEPYVYKCYSKATFNGFKRDYPIGLRQVLDPIEFDQMIQEINIRSIRTKSTPVLKGSFYIGWITYIIFVGFPILFGCFLSHKYIYSKFYKKLSKDIKRLLFEFNNTEVCKRKGIVFSLQEILKTSTSFDYRIVVSYIRQPGQTSITVGPSTTININNNVSVRRNNSNTSNNNNNMGVNNKRDVSMDIPIDTQPEKVSLQKKWDI